MATLNDYAARSTISGSATPPDPVPAKGQVTQGTDPEQMDVSRKVPLGAETPEERNAIAMNIAIWLQAGLDSWGSMAERWAAVEKLYDNAPPETPEDEKPFPNAADFHIPLLQPRVDQLGAMTCDTVIGQKPWMISTDEMTGTRGDKQEQLVYRFWKQARFDIKLREAHNIAALTNNAFYRLTWVAPPKGLLPENATGTRMRMPGSYHHMGVQIDVIHPKYMALFPACVESIEGLRLIGHCVWRRAKELQQYQDLGIYFEDVNIIGGDDPSERDSTGYGVRSLTGASSNVGLPEDYPVEVWDLIIRLAVDKEGRIDPTGKGIERLFRVTYLYKQQALLDIEPYPFSRPWYFGPAYYKVDPNSMLKAGSMANNLQTLQLVYNQIWSMAYNAQMIVALPPILGTDLPEKFLKAGMGDLIEADMQHSPFSPNGTFNGTFIEPLLEGIEHVADLVSRVSQNSMGSTTGKDTTATEDSIMSAGVQTGQAEYIANFTSPLPEMAMFTIELLKSYYPIWSIYYKGVIECDIQDLLAPCYWEVNGTTPGNTPQSQAQWAQLLAKLLQTFGQSSGLELYPLIKTIVTASQMPNAEAIMLPPDQYQAMMQQMQAQQQAAMQQGQPPNGQQPPQGAPAAPPTMAPQPGNTGLPGLTLGPESGIPQKTAITQPPN